MCWTDRDGFVLSQAMRRLSAAIQCVRITTDRLQLIVSGRDPVRATCNRRPVSVLRLSIGDGRQSRHLSIRLRNSSRIPRLLSGDGLIFSPRVESGLRLHAWRKGCASTQNSVLSLFQTVEAIFLLPTWHGSRI